MSKPIQPKNDSKRSKGFYFVHPWEARHHKDHSELKAYVEASGTWETIIEVRQTSGSSHETMALFLLAIINEHQAKRHVLHDAMEALELVINDGLTFSSEQAIEHIIADIRQVMK